MEVSSIMYVFATFKTLTVVQAAHLTQNSHLLRIAIRRLLVNIGILQVMVKFDAASVEFVSSLLLKWIRCDVKDNRSEDSDQS